MLKLLGSWYKCTIWMVDVHREKPVMITFVFFVVLADLGKETMRWV